MTTSLERKFAMTRAEAGVYLLPSNDGKTLWRINRYEEDGSASEEVDGRMRPIKGMFWATAHRPMPSDEEMEEWSSFSDFIWSQKWIWWSHLLNTRREAIEDALRTELRKERTLDVH